MHSVQKYLWQLILCALGIVLVWVVFPSTPQAGPVADSPLNTTYRVEGRLITLVDGKAEVEVAPGAATVIRTEVFGQPSIGDLNADGLDDAALLLVQDPGGTGTFYYLAAAINTGRGYRGTNALFLGDRIAPQNVEIREGVVIANYADRGPDESFAVRPSYGKSLYAEVRGATLIDITAQRIGR